MKIPSNPSIPDARPRLSSAKAASSEDARAATTAAATERIDRVSLEASAVAVAATHRSEKELRADRLKRLDAKVKDGSYRPDASETADRMIEACEWLQALDDDLKEQA